MNTLHTNIIGTDNLTIAGLVRSLGYYSLKELLPIVQAELDRKNPENIERDRKMNEYWKQREQEAKEHKKFVDNLIATLKPQLKPGMLLKMRGCKDGTGLREFIRWDGENLVCWQIKQIPHRGPNGMEIRLENANIVTTHMADKVAGVYSSKRKMTKIKEILAGAPVPS